MKTDWMSCDGTGGSQNAGSLSRRELLKIGALGTLGALVGGSPALADLTVRPGRAEGPILVSLFLRGGADGLHMVPPYADAEYHRLRPTLALQRPGASNTDSALRIDDFFGLHPAMGSWRKWIDASELAIVHAVGSGDHTRSHFEAMSVMERGSGGGRSGDSSGWLARYLTASRPPHPSPMRAIAFGGTMPDSLVGGPDALAMESLLDFRLNPADTMPEPELRRWLREVYAGGGDEVSVAGRATLDVLDALSKLDVRSYKAEHGAAYPASDLAAAFKQVAFLAKNNVGLEVAALDKGGWDTHVGQGAGSGWMATLLRDLADSIHAFWTDLGPIRQRVTLVVQTEFGRRAFENTGLGTDHGRGSVMFVFGAGLRGGGKVHARWPGLREGDLEDHGDLRVTTDYRDVLSEVLARRMALPNAGRIFGDFTPTPLQLI